MAEDTSTTTESPATPALDSGSSASSLVLPEGAKAADDSPPPADSRAKGGGEEGGVSAASDTPPPEKEAKPPEPKGSSEEFAKRRLQQRVDKLTAQKRSLEAQLAAQQAGGKAPSATDEAELQRLVDARAEALAEQKVSAKLAERVVAQTQTETFNEGVKLYGREEFVKKVELLKQIRDETDVEEQQQYDMLIGAAIETGEGARIVALLSEDLELASRLMSLSKSPVKLGIELAKLAAKDPPEPISDVPKPILPIGNRGRSHVQLSPSSPEGDRLSTAEWMKRRSAHADEVNRTSGRRLL